MSLISPLADGATEAECRHEFDGMKLILERRFPDAELVDEWSGVAPGLTGTRTGYAVAYDLVDDFFGATMPLRSEAYLFCNVDKLWAVKYRITYPRAVEARSAIASFIATTPTRTGP